MGNEKRLLLYAEIPFEEGWQKSISEMIGRASRWYTLSVTPETVDEIVITVPVVGKSVTVKKRALGRSNLMLFEKCPYRALVIMALCNLFKADAFDTNGEKISLKEIRPDLPHLAGADTMDFCEIVDAAADLGLVMPRLKPKSGSGKDIFSI